MWIHAGDVAKEGVSALLDEVANVRKACTMSYIGVLDLMEPAHADDTSLHESACGMLACRWFKSTLVEVNVSDASCSIGTMRVMRVAWLSLNVMWAT